MLLSAHQIVRCHWLSLALLILATSHVYGEDSSPALDAYLAAQRDAAIHAAKRDVILAGTTLTDKDLGLPSRALGMPGTITIDTVSLVAPADASTVPRFAKVELLVSIPTLSATKPFNPSPAAGGLDLGAQFTGPDGVKSVKGYWDGTNWRVRFAPHTVGSWTYTVSATDSSGTATWNGGTFTCVPSTNSGFLRIRNASLEFSGTNKPFIGVGHNIGWQMQVEHPALSGETPATLSYGTVPATPALTAERAMAANGQNLLVFWMSAPWELPSGSYRHRAMIEATSTGLGIYNQAPCQYIDQLLEKAEAAGVYLLPAIWPHDAVRGADAPQGVANWSGNAYSTICAASAFTVTNVAGVDTPQWIAQRNFFRYLTARFGYSTALAGWIGIEGLDRIDAWALNQGSTRAWCQSVETWFAQNDVFRSNGNAFPITFNNMGSVVNETSLWSHNNWNASYDNLAVATTFAQQILQYAGKARYINEFGASVGYGATQPTHLHNAIWASIAAGASATPMVWGDGQGFPRLSDGANGQAMQSHLRWLSQFLRHVPWAGYHAATSVRISDASFAAWYTHVSDRGFGWVYRTDGYPLISRTLALSASPGNYTIWWFDPNGDCTTPFATTAATVTSPGNQLALPLPAGAIGLQDVAWHYQQHPTVTVGLSHSLLGGIPRTITLDNSPSYNFMIEAVITSLPADVRLYRTSDGVTRGEEITSVPAVISNAPLRVIAVSDNLAGTRTFDFHLTEVGTASASATMTLSLVLNQLPIADSATATISENTPYPMTLSGSDPEGYPITFALQTPPTHGVLSGTAPNLTYTPSINYHGDDSFTFTTHDGIQSGAPATITLQVEHSDLNHNYPPSANGSVVKVAKNTSIALTLTGSDPEMQPLTFQILTPPLNGLLSGTAPDLVYTPTTGYHGRDSFTFAVHDGVLASAPATVNIRVQGPDESPRCGIGGGTFALVLLGLAGLIALRFRARQM